MAFLLKATSHVRMFYLVASSDHLSKLTGGSPTVNLSKNGAGFAAAAGSVAEVLLSAAGTGWYSVTLSTVDTGTAGDLAYHVTCASADDTDFCDQVVDPAVANLGVNVVNIAGTASAGTAGYTAPDWAHISAPTTTVDLSGTTIKNVDNAIATVTTVTNQLTAAAIATGVWTDTTAGDFTTAVSVGKSLMNGVSLGTGLKVAECVLADTLTTYTGNTPQTGDAYARIGAAGAGLTGVTGVTLAAAQKVDVDTIKTNPVVNAGTVTFPTSATLASTTNITAGTIATVTNLTNAPTAGDLTATMKTSVTTAATAATPTIAGYTGNTPQTGDSYGLLTGVNTEVTSVPTSVDTLVNMIKWLFALSRNKVSQTATTQLLRNNADGATIGTSTVSDDGTTAIRGKFV